MHEEQAQEQDARQEPGRGRTALLLLGLASLLTVGYLIYRETRADTPFRRYQQRYRDLLSRKSGQPVHFRVGIRMLATASGHVDRCPTCHLGIAIPADGRPVAKDPGNPFRPHPGALLQQHRPGRFACTACHGAGGERVDRCLPAASAADPDGRALDRMMAQASCRGCHRGYEAEQLPGAPQLTRGLMAWRRLGCAGCHRTQTLETGKKPRRIGPSLEQVADKLDVTFVRAFLADPQKVRPGTAMPSFFSDDALRGAPAFAADPIRAQRRSRVEQLVALLYTKRTAEGRPQQPGAGDAAAGARRFVELGCVACHRESTLNVPGARAKGLGGIGPDLSEAGGRLRGPWLDLWLRSPRRISPETLMPDLRLTDTERQDLVARLGSLGTRPAAARPPDPALAEQGRALAEKLGCPGCHRMAAFNAKEPPPVGPDLDGYGDKVVDLLDWGGHPTPVERRTRRRWTELKLTRPLAFDRPPGVLLMPWQKLRSGEVQGLLVLLRSLTETEAGPVARATERARHLRRGESLVQTLGCRQCHSVGGEGAPIRALWPRPSDRPPPLDHQGAKVLPQWLQGFLRRPIALRPWLAMRMPAFDLDAEEAAALAGYFAAQDRASFPFVPPRDEAPEGAELEGALALFTKMQCVRCHLLSNAPTLKPGELAPDLALSGNRLRRDWIRRFVLEPQKVLPGTKMPTLFPLADEDDPKSRTTPEPQLLDGSVPRQVDALTDLNLAWGSLGAAAREGR